MASSPTRSSRHRRPRSSAESPPDRAAQDPYRDLADDYHWLFHDTALRVGTDTPGVRAALLGLPERTRILDAACGIGVDVEALVRRGFEAAGADASPAMLAKARSRLSDAGVEAVLVESEWRDLARHFGGESFDSVFCTGNSLSHSGDVAQLTTNVAALAELLRPTGTLIADAQHWEYIHDRGSHRFIDPLVVERDGISCERRFDWTVPTDFSEPFELDLVLAFADRDSNWERRHHIEFHAFRREDLRSAVRSAGLGLLTLDAADDADRYAVVARRPAS